MPECKMYRYDKQGYFEAEDVTYSDKDIDFVRDYRPPAMHTWTPPPKYDPKTEIPQFVKGEWRIVLLADLKPPEPTLEELKAMKIAELDSLWGEKMAEGYQSTLKVDGKPLKVKTQSDDYSMLAMGLQKASKRGTLALLRDYEGNLFRNVSVAIVAGLYEEVDAHMESLWARKVLLQEKAKLAKTAEEVNAITWETEI